MRRNGRILLGHGAGGRLTSELVREAFVPAFDNRFLHTLSDSAVLDTLPAGRPALTTDGFVVDPPVFPGGDLGYLSVCGTVNDLSVAGARPLWLTFSLILEEGLETELLDTIVAGAARAAREAGIAIVAGDTKVVPRGKADRAFVVTSGLGVVPAQRELDDTRIRPGDRVIVTGPVGDHGATVLGERHGLQGDELRSDCRPLNALLESVWSSGLRVRAAHDPTRGGLATTCNETAARARARIVLDECSVPIRQETSAVCDLLGVDPLYLACEGRAVLFVDPADADDLVAALRRHPDGRESADIGWVAEGAGVVMQTRVGGEMPLDLLSGMDLPRIC